MTSRTVIGASLAVQRFVHPPDTPAAPACIAGVMRNVWTHVSTHAADAVVDEALPIYVALGSSQPATSGAGRPASRRAGLVGTCPRGWLEPSRARPFVSWFQKASAVTVSDSLCLRRRDPTVGQVEVGMVTLFAHCLVPAAAPRDAVQFGQRPGASAPTSPRSRRTRTEPAESHERHEPVPGRKAPSPPDHQESPAPRSPA